MLIVYVLLSCASVILTLIFWWYYMYYRWERYLNKFPGPKPIPIAGNTLEFRNSAKMLPTFLKFRETYNGNFKIYLGHDPMLVISEPKAVEFLLSSTVILDKSKMYDFLHKWLGIGLLTSGGKIWKQHRKIIAPVFHNQLLEKYVENFDSPLNCLIENLSKEIVKESTDMYPYITACALDIICESMMGTPVNAQKCPNSDYVRSVKELLRIVNERIFSVTQKYDWLYCFSQNYSKEKEALKIIHTFTDSVVRNRKMELIGEKEAEDDDTIQRKKLSFLDLLLQNVAEENVFTDRELRDEVDIMLFAGHETTATSTAFVLYCLSNYPKIQEKAWNEIKNILSDDLHKPISYKHLQHMHYLELIIKESMRLYTTVPLFGREVKEDVLYDGILLPKGLTIAVLTTGVHKDPNVYPDPEKFDPDRFLPHNAQSRNSYAYLPFSHGPRNCIGQKFAMLEMKAIVTCLLRNFEFLPTTPAHQVELILNMNLKPSNGILLQLKKRI